MNSFSLKGKLDVILTDKSGKVREERHVDNLIVTTGSYMIADIFSVADSDRGAYSARPCAMAVGTNAKSGSRYKDSGGSWVEPTAAATINVASAEDERLWWEIDRVSGTSNFTVAHSVITVESKSPSGENTIEYTGVFGANENGCGYINEAGIFNSTAAVEHETETATNKGIQSGIMLNRATFLPVYKEPTDILTIIWKITIQPKTDS